jgi:hypothetical protein
MSREEHRLRIFKNRVLRRIFERNREYSDGASIKLHNEELHSLYSSPNIIMVNSIKEDYMSRECSMHGGDEKCIQNFT